MRILLHASLHPTFWLYIIDKFPEYEWIIEKKEKGQIPFDPEILDRNLKNLQIISRKEALKQNFDLQLILLHTTEKRIKEILHLFHQPIVWVQFWRSKIFAVDARKIYPLIYTSQTSFNKEYQGMKHCLYIRPTERYWNIKWKGDRKEVFVPAQQYYTTYAQIRKEIEYLKEKNIPLNLTTEYRTIPHSEWKKNFIHSRVYLEISTKTSSFILLEAMLAGMPCVVRNKHDFPKIIRNKIDGFVFNHVSELPGILNKLLNDQNLAKEYGKRAKARLEELSSFYEEKIILERIFAQAILIGDSSQNLYRIERKIPDKKLFKILLICKQVFNDLNMSFFITKSLALGLYKENNFINSNIDLGILGKKYSSRWKEIEEKFDYYGLKMRTKFSKGKPMITTCKTKDYSINIYYHYSEKKLMWIMVWKNNTTYKEVYSEDLFESFDTLKFRTLILRIPSPEKYLKKIYKKKEIKQIQLKEERNENSSSYTSSSFILGLSNGNYA